MKNTFLILFLTASSFFAVAQQSNNVQVLKTFHIKSTGGWDYIAVSPVKDWVYVSHGFQVNILNKTTGDSVGVIEHTTGVHGIAFDATNAKGYTSNGKLNSVTVFDANTNQVLAQIPTGLNPDAILYESFSKKIVTCNGRGKNLTIIDPALNKAIDSIDVGGKPEMAVSDGKGRLFVNLEDKNEIVQIDMKTFKVLNHWSIAPAEGPTGLAYDDVNKRLFAGCEKELVVVNADNGKVVARLPIGEGCDGVAFDKKNKNIYTANGEGTLTVIHQQSPDKYKVLANVTTKKGARTIALDNATQLMYLPTADFETPVDAKGKSKMIPGTFQVLVVGVK